MVELKDFPGYFVSEDGRIFSARKKKPIPGKGSISYLDYNNLTELKPTFDARGYYKVRLSISKDKKQYTKNIHRLVAETFIPNPHNLPQVNHIDENKSNNHVDNLEWVTNHQNIVHSCCRWIWTIENVVSKEQFKVVNVNEFCRKNGLNEANLRKTFTGKQKTHKNHRIISKTQFK